MKRNGHTAEQIIHKLKGAKQLNVQNKCVTVVWRLIEVTQPT